MSAKSYTSRLTHVKVTRKDKVGSFRHTVYKRDTNWSYDVETELDFKNKADEIKRK